MQQISQDKYLRIPAPKLSLLLLRSSNSSSAGEYFEAAVFGSSDGPIVCNRQGYDGSLVASIQLSHRPQPTNHQKTTVKRVSAALLRATERHLPYGITQCYLPLDTGERAPP